MSKIFTYLAILYITFSVSAQKVDYKKNMISVDGKTVAKVDVEKEKLGLTKNFSLLSLNGEKLIIATLSTEFQNDPNDNLNMYYRFTFLPTNQIGIFKLPILGMEKNFVNLIGKAQIIDGETLNAEKVNELIAMRGVSPRTVVNYLLVSRDRNWPIELSENKSIQQNGEEIGFFKHTGQINSHDNYDFYLPDGVMIAKISFAGGNNAQNFELFTTKDNTRRMINISSKDQVKFHKSTIDPNALTIKRVTTWLVENNYL